jgi:AbrB family looped-hinge helix DNA binding protein
LPIQTVTRLTTKHQTTIPAAVRRALGLKAGDRVAFAITGKTVTIARARPGLRENLAWRLTRARSMGDRDTPEDDEAFRDL